MFGEHTLFRFEWRTASQIDEVEWPRIEIWSHFGSIPRIENKDEQLQGKGFSDHFLHQDIWLQKRTEVFG